MQELLELFHHYPGLLYTFAGLFGAILGSFLNAAIYRLPRNISMLKRTRSFCPSCEHNLAWYDNLPILSYMALAGKCHYCHKPIGIRYLLIELLTVAMTELVVYHTLILNPTTLGFVGMVQLEILGLGSILLLATDFESYLIPDEASVFPLVVSLALAWFVPHQHQLSDTWVRIGGASGSSSHAPGLNALIDALQGAMLAGGMVYAIGAFGTWWKRKPAMGDGDVLLMAAVGATVGWKLGVIAIFFAAFVGLGMYLLLMLWMKLKKQTAEPPRFDLPGDSASQPVWYSRLLNAFSALGSGIGLVIINGIWLLWAREQTLMLQENPSILFGPILGLAFGAIFILYHFIRAQHIAKGTWVLMQVETGADGKQVEVYDPNEIYFAFGPALSVSGFFMAIWGPWFLQLIERHVLKVPPEMLTTALKTPFVG